MACTQGHQALRNGTDSEVLSFLASNLSNQEQMPNRNADSSWASFGLGMQRAPLLLHNHNLVTIFE